MSTLKVNTLQTAAGVEVYTAKAWVNFNGTGTVAIRGSGNVTNITDNGTGLYTVNFTTALPDANYAGVVTASTKGSTDSYAMTSQTGSSTTTYGAHSTTELGVNTASGGGVLIDPETVQVAVFR
jgi:hypothetical protein